MLDLRNVRRTSAAVVVALCALLLSACFVLPGKFAATLDLRKDGHFTYTYNGQIVILGLTKLAEMAMAQKPKPEFAPSACYKKDGETERDCTPAEVTAQMKDWQAAQTAQAEKDARDKEMIVKALGGIDPTDPKASAQFAEHLARQAGWKSVVSKGDGRFEVDYAIAGRLTHDFTFPTVERMPMLIPFVSVIRRNDGSVRMDAPAFSSGQSAGPLAGFAGMAGALGGADKPDSIKPGEKPATPPGFPVLDGHFMLHTDGTILANNTDEGAKAEPGAQRLEWMVNPQTTAPPTALIRF